MRFDVVIRIALLQYTILQTFDVIMSHKSNTCSVLCLKGVFMCVPFSWRQMTQTWKKPFLPFLSFKYWIWIDHSQVKFVKICTQEIKIFIPINPSWFVVICIVMPLNLFLLFLWLLTQTFQVIALVCLGKSTKSRDILSMHHWWSESKQKDPVLKGAWHEHFEKLIWLKLVDKVSFNLNISSTKKQLQTCISFRSNRRK